MYEPIPDAIPDMDCPMYWLCNEAASEIDSSVRIFYSAKIWIRVRARYESANPDAPNYKAFEAKIGKNKTTIGYHPLTVGSMRDLKNLIEQLSENWLMKFSNSMQILFEMNLDMFLRKFSIVN